MGLICKLKHWTIHPVHLWASVYLFGSIWGCPNAPKQHKTSENESTSLLFWPHQWFYFLFIYLFSIHLSFIYLVYLFINLFIFQSIYFSIFLFISLFINLFINLFIYSFIHLFIHLFFAPPAVVASLPLL
jgi:hypothetical protein